MRPNIKFGQMYPINIDKETSLPKQLVYQKNYDTNDKRTFVFPKMPW